MVAFTPVLMQHPLNAQLQETADSPQEYAQLKWDGWYEIGSAPPPEPTLRARLKAVEETIAAGLPLGTGSVTSGKLASKAVTAAKLGDDVPAALAAKPELRAAFVPRDEYAAGGGGSGPGGYVHTQGSPSASWSITNPLGRMPSVDLYVAGQQVEADVEATTSTVSVTFPAPTAGFAVLV